MTARKILAEVDRGGSIVSMAVLRYEDHVAFVQVHQELDLTTHFQRAHGETELCNLSLRASADLTAFVQENGVDHLDVLRAGKDAAEHETDTVSDGQLAFSETNAVGKHAAGVNMRFCQDT